MNPERSHPQGEDILSSSSRITPWNTRNSLKKNHPGGVSDRIPQRTADTPAILTFELDHDNQQPSNRSSPPLCWTAKIPPTIVRPSPRTPNVRNAPRNEPKQIILRRSNCPDWLFPIRSSTNLNELPKAVVAPIVRAPLAIIERPRSSEAIVRAPLAIIEGPRSSERFARPPPAINEGPRSSGRFLRPPPAINEGPRSSGRLPVQESGIEGISRPQPQRYPNQPPLYHGQPQPYQSRRRARRSEMRSSFWSDSPPAQRRRRT